MEGGYIPRLPHGYATAGTASYYGKSAMINALCSQKGWMWAWDSNF